MATRIIEWYVKASRNQTSVWLAAPEGRVEAQAMAHHLRGYDWHDVEVVDNSRPVVSEPEPKAVARSRHTGPWPVCERCTGKHSPFTHEAEVCEHCMGNCQKPKAVPQKTSQAETPIEAEARPEFRHGMTFAEFKDWLEKAL